MNRYNRYNRCNKKVKVLCVIQYKCNVLVNSQLASINTKFDFISHIILNMCQRHRKYKWFTCERCNRNRCYIR